MNFERYSRQIQLKEFGLASQKKLSTSKVLVVGAGGLGIPALTYLNAMGVGTLGIIDNDVVGVSNLHRQVSYTENDIGKSKITVLAEKLKAQNSDTKLIMYDAFLVKQNALEILSSYDLIIDASDNFPTRYLVNDACVILDKPFIYGALHSFEGQVSVFNYKNGPTYRCLFPTMPKANEVPNCNENGVLGVIPGIIGNLQALEAVKVITEIGEVLSGKLLLFDGLNQNFQKINFKKVAKNGEIKMLNESYEFECDVNLSITSLEFQNLLKIKKIQLLDVRTKQEFDSFHLKDGIHIPISEIIERQSELDFTKTIYVICQSGQRSQKAINLLVQQQPKATFINVSGGINQMDIYALK
tara:strand:- start:323 stop:1390 length:1068 start_codon:yes stop_codon:yes gene_type:complete